MAIVEPETLSVALHTSQDTKEGQLIVSVTNVTDAKHRTVDLVVGRVGVPSIERTLKVGGAILFETLDEGLFEVRVLQILEPPIRHAMYKPPGAVVRISHLSPGRGAIAGLGADDIANTPFEPHEVSRIRASLKSVQADVAQRPDVTPEQQDYLNRKLDEVIDAATRVGRKDWINLAIGTLTNAVVNSGLTPVLARFIFQAAGDALAWLVGQTLRLLS